MGNQFSWKIITPDGVTFDLDPKSYFVDVGMDAGLGLPPIEHATQSVYQQPGALLKSIKVQPRTVTITLTMNADCRSQLHTLRSALWNALRWNRTTDEPPAYATLRYESDKQAADLHVYYAGDVFSNVGGDDKAGLDGVKLIAYDPAWYAVTENTEYLSLPWSATVSYIASYNGSAWSAMGNSGTGAVWCVAESPDGNTLYIGGEFENWAGVANADYIAAYNKTTGVWSALGTGMNDWVYALAVDSAGNLYAGGIFTQAGGGAASCVAMWNGAAWSALGAGTAQWVVALAVDASDNLYVGGAFATAGGNPANRIAKWNGATWSALGTGAEGGVAPNVKVLLASPDKTLIYVGGRFNTADGVTCNNVAVWDGSAFSALGTGVTSTATVYALTLDSGGDLYAGGDFTTAGGLSALGVAKWSGVAWSALGTGLTPSGSFTYELACVGGDLYAGGTFTGAGGVTVVDGLAKWNGTAWERLDINLPGTPDIHALYYDGENLYVGFDTTGTATNGIATVARIAGKIDGVWSAMGGAGTGAVLTFAESLDGNTLYVGGDFENWEGIAAADHIAAYNISTGVWSALGTGVDDAVWVLAVAPNGDLYAGGTFHNAGGGGANHIAKWNGSAWSALGAGTDGLVQGLCFDTTGNLYATGQFNNAGGGGAVNIAKWDGANWTALGTGLSGLGAGSRGYALALAANGTDVYVGGAFTDANGVAANYIAKWNGTTFEVLGTGFNNDVRALALTPAGILYAVGNFTTAGGIAATYAASWNGVAWSPLGSGLNNTAYSLSYSNGSIYVGGFFTAAGGSGLSDRFAQWNGTAWISLDIDLPGTPVGYAILHDGTNLFLGFDTTGAATVSIATNVPYSGNEHYFPTLAITGPGTLQYVTNTNTGKTMFFNCYLNTGEVATIDLSPGVKTFTSNWRGNLLSYASLLPASDFGTFALVPDPIAPDGENAISIYMTGIGATSLATLTYRNAYLDADSAVA